MPECERRPTERSESVARSLFVDTLLSKVCPGAFTQESEVSLQIVDSSEFEIGLDLHVDDGYVTRPAEKMMEVFAYLEF